jgi:hypothetical protein
MAIAPLAFVLTVRAGTAGSQPQDSSAHAVSGEYNRSLGVDCDLRRRDTNAPHPVLHVPSGHIKVERAPEVIM